MPDRIAELRALLEERDKLAAALRDCYKLAYNCHRDELPSAIITTTSKAIAELRTCDHDAVQALLDECATLRAVQLHRGS